MADYPEYSKEDSGLAGIGYIPFFFINLVVPLYVLIKKEGRYVRFHAMQSLVILVIIFLISSILNIVVSVFMVGTMGSAFTAGPEMYFKNFFSIWSSMMVAMLPMMVITLLFILIQLYFAFAAFTGREVRLPVITNFLLERL